MDTNAQKAAQQIGPSALTGEQSRLSASQWHPIERPVTLTFPLHTVSVQQVSQTGLGSAQQASGMASVPVQSVTFRGNGGKPHARSLQDSLGPAILLL